VRRERSERAPQIGEKPRGGPGVRRETGKVSQMRVLYGEGVADHTDREPCGAPREGRVEALAAARAGQPLSREITLIRVADVVPNDGRRYPRAAIGEALRGPARSETLSMLASTLRGNREVLRSPVADGATGRDGKPRGMSRR